MAESGGSARLCPRTDKAMSFYLTGANAARHQLDKVTWLALEKLAVGDSTPARVFPAKIRRSFSLPPSK